MFTCCSYSPFPLPFPSSAEHKEYLTREREQRCLVSSSMREVEEREAWEASCRGDMERGVREDARRVGGEDGHPAHKSSDVKQVRGHVCLCL